MVEKFKDRYEAGKALSQNLSEFKDSNSIILAIPRGGVPVASPISQRLNIPLNILVARKIGDPQNRELGVGGVSEGNVLVLDSKLITELGISKSELEKVIKEEKEELKRRVDLYRNGKSLPSLKNKKVILVDDGVARGVTVLSAIKAVKKLKPSYLVFASPVCSQDAVGTIKKEVDKFVCLITPDSLDAIGEYYENFSPVTDEEVISLMRL